MCWPDTAIEVTGSAEHATLSEIIGVRVCKWVDFRKEIPVTQTDWDFNFICQYLKK